MSWHSKNKEDLLEELQSHHINGLSESEAIRRLERYGQNIVKKQQKRSLLMRFAAQFQSSLIYILLVAALIAALMGESVDAAVIFGVVLINAIVGCIQEGKAQKAIAALDDMMPTFAVVIRDGKRKRMDARFVTVGDIVLLSSGDKVPADIRLLETNSLCVDESILTGESLPVQKEDGILHHSTPLSERTNMAYAGSLVTYGQGYGLVIGIGDLTEIGQIAELLKSTKKLETPLLKKIDELGRLILIFVVGLSAVTLVIGMARGESFEDMLMASVALAVGAIPEGLPAAMTIMLAIGVSAMAAKNAIIRSLPSVETLGSATVICSDKTGTLTKNEMTVQKLYAGGHYYTVSGIGYGADGKIDREPSEELDRLLLIGALCNDSDLKEANNQVVAVGDPTEAALIVAAQKASISKEESAGAYPRLDVLAFESDRQFMATLHKADKKNLLFFKGSVEKIGELCGGIPEGIAEEFARDGLRVLAFAYKEVGEDVEKIESWMLSETIFVGFAAMMDPPRDEAKSAVEICKKAGIGVKMITGDHAVTAVNIAKKLGICGHSAEAVTGSMLAEMDDAALMECVKETNVYARVAPQQKLRLVEAMQANGEVVAMTGDGVNDAPALKRADIGIAMGKGGTDVSKEAADMVLSDDNFASIVYAVEEGRNVYEKFIKFIIWTLPTNIGEGMVIFFAVLSGTALPILPTQVLWINMTTAVLLGLMLVFEPNEKDVMSRKPRLQSAPVVSARMLLRMLIVGILMLFGAFFMFEYELSGGASQEYARSVAVTVFISIEIFYLYSCRSLYGCAFKSGFFANKPLLLGVGLMLFLQGLFLYAPFMNDIFGSAPLEPESVAVSIGIGFLVMLVVEAEKKWLKL